MKSEEDKRRSLRVKDNIVSFDCFVVMADKKYEVFIKDFSPSGLGFFTYKKLFKGDKIEIEISLPGDDIPLYLVGEVVRVTEKTEEKTIYEAGIKIMNINETDRRRLVKHIRKNMAI